MIANYHSHTLRCNHAVGAESEYVEAALQRGLKIFGFSDHSPQYFPGGYCTSMRMRPYQLADYCASVLQLRQTYGGRIQIPLGLEAEYYPGLWKELLPRIQDVGIEYLILGQHWIGDEIGEPGSSAPTDDENILRRYCHQVIEAMETGKFSYVAHPDVIHYIASPAIYRKHMKDLCRAAREMEIPLEMNLLGLSNGKHYPNQAFWEIASEEGCQIILGMDAHAPAHVLDLVPERRALEMIAELNLELLETVPLRAI